MAFLLLCLTAAQAQLAPQDYQEGLDELPFSDIADSPFLHAITYMAADEYIGGFPDGTFRPGQNMTRAEFMVVVTRAAAREAEASGEPFGYCLPVVALDSWYAAELCHALRLGVLSGGSDDELRPDEPITYAEALKMLLTAFGHDAGAPAPGEAWYEPLARFAGTNGLLPMGSYNPVGNVPRELGTNLLYRMLVLARDPTNLTAFDERAALEALVAAAMRADLSLVFDPDYSAGCNNVAVGAPTRLIVGGRERGLITYVPASYNPTVPHSLVVAFHGRTNSNAQVRNYMDLERHSDNTIVVYPAGIPASSGGFSWSDGSDRADALRDYALFDAILATYSQNFCLDLRRVFVVGHSLGAWFANSLACARADVIRGAATLAGGIAVSNCRDRVAAMVLHNPNDQLVPFSDGIRARDAFLSNNGLQTVSETSLGGRFACSAYQAPGDPDPVVWCPHRVDYPFGTYYNPHSWPQGIGQTMIEFFGSLQ